MQFQEIFDKLLVIHNAKSLTELADKLKVERTTLSGWKSREALGTMLEHLNNTNPDLIKKIYCGDDNKVKSYSDCEMFNLKEAFSQEELDKLKKTAENSNIPLPNLIRLSVLRMGLI